MFLKRLSLKGFKSFADEVVLDLEPGVTVVVGPNGSGKSNVVDAIAWVLGAQAPSAVRSQRMDDVVFAGTASRSALGRAEVSLTIDNSSGFLPIEFPEVTVTRTLFRGGDSEYFLNGASCRLLDIQDLLSDVGVGRQQHLIVSQGQIDAVLNARSEDRRSIIEEAAGILKFRKRKEKAERRLDSTRANLDRLSDLQREVRRQLRPLERQAEAARRHGDLVTELNTLRLHRAGVELSELRSLAGGEADRRAELAQKRSRREDELKRLEAEISDAESKLLERGGDDLLTRLARLEAICERGRGLRALLAERRKGVERDRAVLGAAHLVVGLEAELVRAETEERRLELEGDDLSPESDSLVLEEASLAADWGDFKEKWVVEVPSLGGQAAEARGELGVLRAAKDQGQVEQGRLNERLEFLKRSSKALEEEAALLRTELISAEEAEGPLSAEVAGIEASAHEARRTRNSAWERVIAAEADLRAARTRVEALALALDEARSQAGANHLAGVEGVLGTLLDLVEVDDGYQAAFEAAAGDALDAVVLDKPERARTAVESLRQGDFSAAILTVGSTSPTGPTVRFGELIRPRVRARRSDVEPLLDRLLGHAVLVEGELSELIDLVLLHPDVVIVTRDGDRFGPTGWRIGARGRGATGAALADARAQLALIDADHQQAVRFFEDSEHSNLSTEEKLVVLSKDLDAHDDHFSLLAESLQRVQAEQREVATESASLRSRLTEVHQHVDSESRRIVALESRLANLEADEEVAAEESRRITAERNRLEERSTELAARRTSLEVRTADLAGRLAVVRSRVGEVRIQLDQLTEERSEVADRRMILDRKEAAVVRLANELDRCMVFADDRLDALRELRRSQSESVRSLAGVLEDLRKERAGVEEAIRRVRDLQSSLEVDRAETRLRLDGLIEGIRSEFDREPDEVIGAPCPQLLEGVTVEERVLELERELKLMGPINALALDEFESLHERYEFIDEQLEDVRSTRKELRKVIKSIDEEIRLVFSEAFGETSSHFGELFDSLFPGGQGLLRLTNPDDLLSTGIEIEARPSGKNVKKLSLLSGGERSLTALAFLFAVFRSRPSPFYVMDEVEAALDDMNLHRFLNLVTQFRDDAQLLIVSHQKRTMEAADCLYGVSMAAGGSSKVVSERISAARAAEQHSVLTG